jgi:hypothetical protein
MMVLTIVALALVGTIGSSMPAEAGFWIPNQVTGIDLKDFENLVDRGDGSGGAANALLDVGDSLRGVMEVQNTSTGLNGPVAGDYLPTNGQGNPEVTAIFQLKVLAKYPSSFGTFDYIFGPDTVFANEFGLPSGSVAAFYSDPVFEYTTTIDDLTKTVANVESAITNGNPMFAVGFSNSRLDPLASTFGVTQTGDGYWYAVTASDNLKLNGTANFYFGIEVLNGWGVYPASDFIPLQNTLQLMQTLISDKNTFIGKGSTNANLSGTGTSPGSQQKFEVSSNDPAGAKFVPEPVSGAIWLCLSGIGAAVTLARRRRQKAG